MPLDASLVGKTVGAISTVCDARSLMSFSAGVPDERPELYDTVHGLVAHPLYPVSAEWDLMVRHGSVPPSITAAEVARGVHAVHDVLHERAVHPGEEITLWATVVAVDRRPAGASQTVCFVAQDAGGDVVWRTRHVSVFRGVELLGEPRSADVEWPSLPARTSESGGAALAERASWVRPIDAHVYTECARIWNPIHTDLARARGAGLDAPILHGTATLARAVSITTELAGVPLARVRRVAASFSAMVNLGSTIGVRLLEASLTTLHFDVLTEDGQKAIRSGTICV